jgi:hypothetical protein
VRSRQRILAAAVAAVAGPMALVSATPQASAECTSAGNSTVCAQGTVRGGGPTPPSAGPAYPSYCADPWYCDDGWDVDVIWRPGRPGGPGGIGPRR